MPKSFAALSAALLLAAPCLSHAANVGIGFSYHDTATLATNLQERGDTVGTLEYYTSRSLAGFDVYISDGTSYFNAAALDTFVYNGGTLVQLPWSFTQHAFTANTTVFGKRNNAITKGEMQAIAQESASWLLDGVALPSAGTQNIGYEQGNAFADGATPVLSWEDGTALLGYRQYGAGTVIAFNVNLLVGDASPLDAAWSNRIVYNAIDHAVSPVPEPDTWALLGAGLVTIALRGRRRESRHHDQKFG